MKKKLGIILLSLLVGYLILISLLFWKQDAIIFQGKALDEAYQFEFEEPFAELEIKSSSAHFINAILFNPASSTSKGTILYFHGNADNMQRWGAYAVDFTNLGYQVLMIDYTGFGKSEGTPTEEQLYQNAEDAWSWAQHHLKEKNFIIYGRSLGTAVAARLASKHRASQLILETPFYELSQERLRPFFPFGLNYDFPTYKYLPIVAYPITIIQGTDDTIVPYSSALKLKHLLKPTDQFFIIEGGGHKNLREFDQYHKFLKEIL
ncbi:MAG: alpha/beta fold hydrolase [Cyclobacteriaceae bacterium]|nr:alpha/beta fold hydrolase [Cyclobacteriaceae bacterium]